MAAVRQDLPLEFVGEDAGGATELGVMSVAAEPSVAEPDRCREPVLRQRVRARGVPEAPHGPADGAQEAMVERVVAAFEDQRGLADPRDQAPRQDVDLAGTPGYTAVPADEFVNQ